MMRETIIFLNHKIRKKKRDEFDSLNYNNKRNKISMKLSFSILYIMTN